MTFLEDMILLRTLFPQLRLGVVTRWSSKLEIVEHVPHRNYFYRESRHQRCGILHVFMVVDIRGFLQTHEYRVVCYKHRPKSQSEFRFKVWEL